MVRLTDRSGGLILTKYDHIVGGDMGATVNILEAKTTLSKLIERVESGAETEVIISRHGRPVARLSAMPVGDPGLRIGVAKGRFDVPPPSRELEEQVARLFAGGGD
ncbi:MAG: type II toxin-antitoxin system Phd/YefM family antitoxin [Thiotrichales bacterium]